MHSDRTDITILPFEGHMPSIAEDVFIASGARIVGEVSIGEGSSIWFNVVIRGDVNAIEIGRRTNIQDLTMCHVTNRRYELRVGDGVTVGHCAMLHGCTVGDGVLVGMSATLLDGCVIGDGAIVAAGAVVRERFEVPPGVLVAGVPARIVRELTPQERASAGTGSGNYIGYVARYRADGSRW